MRDFCFIICMLFKRCMPWFNHVNGHALQQQTWMLTNIINSFLFNQHSFALNILTFILRNWFNRFIQKIIAIKLSFFEIKNIIQMFFRDFTCLVSEFFIQHLFQINATKTMWNFYFIINQISKRQINVTLFCSWIISDHITKFLRSNSTFDLTKKLNYDFAVFVVYQHVSIENSVLIFVSDHQKKQFLFKLIDVMNVIHQR